MEGQGQTAWVRLIITEIIIVGILGINRDQTMAIREIIRARYVLGYGIIGLWTWDYGHTSEMLRILVKVRDFLNKLTILMIIIQQLPTFTVFDLVYLFSVVAYLYQGILGIYWLLNRPPYEILQPMELSAAQGG